MANDPIILTGFMGAGKTSVAAALGNLLHRLSQDLDDVILAKQGRTPKQLIEHEGELTFRALESRLLEQVLNMNDAIVIALGGGTWIVEQNRQLIEKRRCISFWLDAPFDLCWKRIQAGGGERPLAKDEADARALYEKRQPHYALAQFRIAVTADKTIDEIANQIAAVVTNAQM